MPDQSTQKYVFIGGSADGKHLPAGPGEAMKQITSLAGVTDEPTGLVTGDPRPVRLPVKETYQAITVSHAEGISTAYVLNEMSDNGIRPQVVKHFGTDATYVRGLPGS